MTIQDITNSLQPVCQKTLRSTMNTTY